MLNKSRAACRRALVPVLLALTVASTGCLGVVAGLGAAGAAGYVYYRGKVCQDYPADFQTSWHAVRATLQDLKFPVVRELPGTNQGSIESETADGSKISIDVEVLPSRIPAEGSVTRVCVRVGLVGDQQLSRRLLDEISYRLAQPQGIGLSTQPSGAAPPRAITSPAPRPIAPAPPRGGQETAEPPVAPKTPGWSAPRAK